MKVLVTSIVASAAIAIAVAGSVGSKVAYASRAATMGGRSSSSAVQLRSRIPRGEIYYDIRKAIVQGCYMALDVLYGGGSNYYVRARFYSYQVSCTGTLFRTTGRGYIQVSASHGFNPGEWASTGWYWDGPGNRAKACALSDTLVGKCTSSY